jgi:subtilisin family serine protease
MGPPPVEALARMTITRLVFAACCVGSLLAGACARSPDGPVVASTDPRQNVMVIDEGIDLTAAELNGKVTATFTLVCQPAPSDDAGAADGAGADGGSADAGAPSFDDLKQRTIAALMVPDDSCDLQPGIDAKPDPLASVARFRDRWNNMVRSQLTGSCVFSMAEWTELIAALDAESKTFAYHGTATAGTVAHDNSGVRLVLVQRVLGSEEAAKQSFTCLAQADIDQTVALLSDTDVRDAYVHAPASQSETQFGRAVQDYNVGIISESFSRSPRAVIEQLQIEAGCPPIDLRAYFTALNGVEQARAGNPGSVLVDQSAGNEATEIESPADDVECTLGSSQHLLVGSYDLTQTRSVFTNFGACVDVSAPGENIIAPYAGGWLLPVEGTSFAAPLVARQVSRTAPQPYDVAQARVTLLSQSDGQGDLSIRMFPRDFFYAPGWTNSTSGALTTGAAVPAVRAIPRFTLRRPTSVRVDLRPFLSPILRTRSLRR